MTGSTDKLNAKNIISKFMVYTSSKKTWVMYFSFWNSQILFYCLTLLCFYSTNM